MLYFLTAKEIHLKFLQETQNEQQYHYNNPSKSLTASDGISDQK